MNTLSKTILAIITIILVAFIFWYFANIIAYIIIAFILSMFGHPLIELLDKIRIKNYQIPRSVSAAFTLLSIWGIGFLLIILIFPILAKEASNLSSIDKQMIMNSFNGPVKYIENLLIGMNIKNVDFIQIQEFISSKLMSILGISQLSNMFNFFTKLLGNAFVGFFAITFITFFFLKDEKLFGNIILTISPTKHERKVKHIMFSIKKLLGRYFLGLFIDVLIVFTLVSLGMTIIGLDFQQAIVIGLFAGLLNVIPYVGPIIAIIFGLSFAAISHIELNLIEDIFPLFSYMMIVYVIVQIIDGMFLQPFIYSNSVKAHPLEIFLVILSAGYIAGIAGMLVAIPTYTIIRVIAKEFFINFKFVKKLTEKL